MKNNLLKHNTIKFATLIVLLALLSCSNKKMSRIAIADGTYKGQFIRSSPLARYAASNVTITIVGNQFSGQSDKPNYPAICRGTFKLHKNSIEFIDDCSWTADFDWSYILKGTFEFYLKDGKLEMTRSIGDNTDHYALELQ